jgi:hypothetical protein
MAKGFEKAGGRRSPTSSGSPQRTVYTKGLAVSVTPANSKATAQAKDKRDALTLALVLVVICLGNLALVLASGTVAQAVELTGLM